MMHLAAGSGLLAVEPNEAASWAGGVAALSLLTIAIGFNVRQYRSQARDIKQLRHDRARDNRVCNWQLSVLADVLEAHRIPMPASFWNVPEDPVLLIHEEEIKERRRRMGFKFKNDESGAAAVSFIGIALLVMSFIAVLLVLVHVLIIKPIDQIRDDTQQSVKQDQVDRCGNSLTADYFVAIQRALAAPPAPNQERVAAVLDLGTTAERIRDRAAICADGYPDPYTPTPGA